MKAPRVLYFGGNSCIHCGAGRVLAAFIVLSVRFCTSYDLCVGFVDKQYEVFKVETVLKKDI